MLLRSLALSILLFAPPAFANGEFCDDQVRLPDDGGAPGPTTGECQTAFAYSALAPDPSTGAQPLPSRELWFDEQVMGLLGAQPDATYPTAVGLDLAIVEPGFGPPPLNTPAGLESVKFAEWSFASDNPSDGVYALVLILTKNATDVVLRTEWRRFDGDPEPMPQKNSTSAGVLLGSQETVLGPLGTDLPCLRLQWNHAVVSITAKAIRVSRPASFTLPAGLWAPARLRAGLLGGTSLRPGTGMTLFWPSRLKELNDQE